MKIDLNKASYDGKWFDFGEARLKIRPYPMSLASVAFKDGAMLFSGDEGMDMFTYCLVDWEGVVDAGGQPLKLTQDVKKKLYDFRLGRSAEDFLSDFVLRTARALTAEIGDDTKN